MVKERDCRLSHTPVNGETILDLYIVYVRYTITIESMFIKSLFDVNIRCL